MRNCSPEAASAAGNRPWHAAYSRARAARRRLAGLGQGGGQMLVAAFARVHTLLGDINRARGTLRLARAPSAAYLVGFGGKWTSQSNPAGRGAMNRTCCHYSCCSIAYFPPSPPCIWQLNSPNDTADAALCSPRLLPPPGMARDMQHAGACEVQGRLLAEMGQQAGRILL